MLTDEIVDEFISKKLEMGDLWREKLIEDKFKFLKELVIAHGIKIYFQNVSYASVSKPKREIPTIEKAIYCGTSMPGGMCVQLNHFFKLILTHLGYNAFNVGVECPEWSTPRSHMGIVVKFDDDDVEDDDDDDQHSKYGEEIEQKMYFVDVGYARPFLEPIPLHKLPYRRQVGGFHFEFRFNQETQLYERIVQGGCPFSGKFEPDSPEKVEVHFDLTPLQFSDFSGCFMDIFSSEATMSFLDSMGLCRLTSVRSDLTDFEFVCCRNVVLVQGTRDTYQETVYESYDAMLPVILKYFPNLDTNELTQAFDHYNEVRRLKKEKKDVEA